MRHLWLCVEIRAALSLKVCRGLRRRKMIESVTLRKRKEWRTSICTPQLHDLEAMRRLLVVTEKKYWHPLTQILHSRVVQNLELKNFFSPSVNLNRFVHVEFELEWQAMEYWFAIQKHSTQSHNKEIPLVQNKFYDKPSIIIISFD